MCVLDLPIDIWIAIASLLSVGDILNVQNTCKPLRDLMAERSIWHCAITDIMSVIHLPGLLDQLPHMSTEDIRAKAVRTQGIHRNLANNPLKPRSVQKRTCSVNVVRVYFVPGGEWTILAFSEGGMDLCATRNIPQPAYSIPCELHRPDVNYMTEASTSCRLGTLIYRTKRSWSEGSTSIVIFSIDCAAATITTIKEVVVNDGIAYPPSLEFDLLAVTWSVDSTGQVFTRIVSAMKENDKEIVMELGIDKVCPNLLVQIVSPELLLIAAPHEYYLYGIPALAALDSHEQNHAQLIWSSKRLVPSFATHFVRCLPGSDAAPCINVVDLCHNSVNVLALSKQPENCQIITQTTLGLFQSSIYQTMASTHIFWVPVGTTPNMISLRAQPYPMPSDRCTLLRRLQHNTDFSTRSLEMTVESSYAVRDLIWDESGRLCVLATGLHRRDPLIVLLLEFA